MKYKVIWDNEHTTDSFEVKSLKDGINSALDVLIEWQMDELQKLKCLDDCFLVTKEQIDRYDYMIDSCDAWICEYDDNGVLRNEHYLSLDEYIGIGWEFFEDFIKHYGFTYKIVDEEM